MNIEGIIAILSSLVGIPLIVFGFIFLNIRNKRELAAMKIKKEMLELEVEKERVHLRLLEAENSKYDRLIGQGLGEEKR